MSKVQTRRSISFAIADFEAAQKLAAHLKIPLAQLAGQALREFVARTPIPAPPPGKRRSAVPPAGSQELARNLQADLDAQVGVPPRKKPAPFNLKAVARAVDVLSKPENQAPVDGEGNVVINVEHGSPMDRILREELRTDHLPVRRVEAPATWAEIAKAMPDVDEVDDQGRPLTAFAYSPGMDDLGEDDTTEAEADHPDAGDIRVVYDEET